MIGIFINSAAIFIGGWLGALFGKKISSEFAAKLNCVFGVCALGLGISSVIQVKNMPVVILALVLGSSLGLCIHLGNRITSLAVLMQKPMLRFTGSGRNKSMTQEEYSSLLITTVVLFCFSSTGIYGSMDAGMTGNISMLLSKSVLDMPTAMIFACSLGIVTCFVALPQFICFSCLFFAAKTILPLTTPDMICDFKACGGLILLATGLRVAKIKDFPIADMIPAMIIVMPLSAIWVGYIQPVLNALSG